MVELGIDRLLSERPGLLAGERIGLVSNPSGVDRKLRSTVRLLHNHDGVTLQRLFGPEHGIRGRARAGAPVTDTTDERTGLPVSSLYGETRRPTAEMLENVDTLVYDIQHLGVRYYTLIYTLAYALERAAEHGTRVVVLDRPNPVAPLGVRGNRVPDEHASFVGDYRLPVTHGLTVGELARYFCGEFGLDIDLTIVWLSDWSRSDWYDETGLAWVPPSPNMPSLATATLYPGTCLFEGTNLSEGRGTTMPFELVGAPWVDSVEWADALNGLGLSGVRFRPAAFTPSYQKHEGKDVEGVQVHLRDRDGADPIEIGLVMLVSAFQRSPEADWRAFDGGYFIDRLAGGSHIRKRLDATDDADVMAVVEAVRDGRREDVAAFRSARESYERY
jgi:beta-N-acetylhexosaminidase